MMLYVLSKKADAQQTQKQQGILIHVTA